MKIVAVAAVAVVVVNLMQNPDVKLNKKKVLGNLEKVLRPRSKVKKKGLSGKDKRDQR